MPCSVSAAKVAVHPGTTAPQANFFICLASCCFL
jgi:hypothetical protein